MGTSSRVRVSREVAALVGAEDLAVLERAAAAGYDCPVCDGRGQLGAEPATLVVWLLQPQVAHARIAHARCSPSQVIDSGQVLAVPPELEMTVMAAVVPHAAGFRALIMAEPPVSISDTSPVGDRTDLIVAHLLDRGLAMVTAAGRRPAPAPDWAVSLPSATEAVITGPGGELFYEGTLVQPAPWRQLVAALGTAELLVGVIGLAALGDASAGLRALGVAARAGLLVGGTVDVR
jgi:hypothetical protein